MKRLLVLAALLAALPAWGALERSDWRTSSPILLPAMAGEGLVYLPLDDEALTAEYLSEYRIVSEGDIEIPYRMVVEEGQTERRTLEGRVLSFATLGKNETQVALDAGAETQAANRVDLRLKGEDFRCRARVEESDDRKTWWLLDDESIVYRHTKRYEQTWVPVPPHERRFLRISLVRLQGKLPKILEASIICEFTIPRRLERVPAEMSRREDTKKHLTLLEFDMQRQSRDLAEAHFKVEQAVFDRAVVIEIPSRVQEEEYRPVGSGRLRRVKAGQKVVLSLQIPRTRRLRLTIRNGDDAPLAISEVTLWRVRRGLVFSADPAKEYELLYANPKASSPEYDIQRLPLTPAFAKLPQASLGEVQKLPPPPPPWSEQHPAIFWVILGLVVLLLALLVLRTMRTVKAGKPQE